MKRFVLILRKVAKFVFRLISSRLSSRGAAGTISQVLETKFVSKLLENAVKSIVIFCDSEVGEGSGENTESRRMYVRT